eukprot:NODE_591_length_1520_cov_102.433719_g435_i0.p1 GENE.NODE_591_length_1520_cov_102.433719_g435_i0~~NODE_591_length_1520_cov_102.433719_g435_i0.p1  ORF type:complete len:423 (+),score=75.97 NODE_591_length_1520_cov_102.433719_g435_i0:158-1270(+)
MSGWSGLIVLVAFATLCWYTALLLGNLMGKYPRCTDYSELGLAIFGPGRCAQFISMCFIVELWLVMVQFVVLVGDNLHALLGNWLSSPECFTLFVAAILPTAWLNDFSHFANVSLIGLVVNVLVLAAVVGVFCVSLYSSPGSLWAPAPTKFYVCETFVASWGIFMNGLGGHGCFPSYYHSMDHPETTYPSMVNRAFALALAEYMLIACAGYAMYGVHTLPEIELNFPHHDVLGVAMPICVVAVGVAKFGLYTSIVCGPLEQLAVGLTGGQALASPQRCCLRTCLVGVCLLLALALPRFQTIVGIVGAIFCIAVSITLPLVMDLCDTQRPFGTKVLHGLLVFGSLVVGCVGSYGAVLEVGLLCQVTDSYNR